MNLRTKIFLMFSLSAVIPLVVLTLYSYHRYSQSIYLRMDDISSNLFENASEEADKRLSGIENCSYAFNYYYKDGNSLIEELKPYSDKEAPPSAYTYSETYRSLGRSCQSLLLSDSNIFGIYVFTPSGYVFDYSNQNNGSVPNHYAFEDKDWYKKTVLLDGGYYISPLDNHSLFTGNKSSIFFSQCLKDVYSHKLAGILVIDCSPAMFDLKSINTMPDIALITIDNPDTGDLLYSSSENNSGKESKSKARTEMASLSLSPLRLTVTVDYETLFQEFNVTGMLLILIGAVCIAGLIAAFYLISGYIVKPIGHLSRKMASQKGHTLIQSTRYLDRTDEIGTLYNEYNAMVESLNKAVKKDYQDKLVLLDAQMKSLEARINSHFLFNTLEAINSMAEIDENEQIAAMSLALGNMFRYTLKTQSELVTVEDELNHVNDYVSIQQIRFDNRFRLETDMSPEFRKFHVLKLILQPLVENALYHGLDYCTCGDTITLSGHSEENILFIDVRDNGRGMSEDTLKMLQKSLSEEASFTELGHRNRQSIGLKNIHSRIELYYGRGYGLTITSQEGEWTNVRIRLPLLQKSNKGYS